MKKIYHLSSCDTCKRILKEIEPPTSFIIQDIKEEPVTEGHLEEMRKRAGSYEALFNKRARLYRQRELNQLSLSEEEFKNLILEHYTFLIRPVIINEENIFIGNSKKTVEAVKNNLHE